MKITTRRLILTKITLRHLRRVHELHAMPETDRYNTQGLPASVEETKRIVSEWIKEGKKTPPVRYTFYVADTDAGFVGLAGIRIGKPHYRNAELWYKMHPEKWNQGYATEVVNSLLDFCFNDLGMHRVEAGCARENAASARVMEKAGMKYEGMRRKLLPIRGEWHDGLIYAMLEDDRTRPITR